MVTICLTATIAFWWLCTRSDAVAFLPRSAGAEWVVYPKTAEIPKHQVSPVGAAFRRSFSLDVPPGGAVLRFRAFRDAVVTINGCVAPVPKSPAAGWKAPTSAEVTRLLQKGTNVLTAWVTNTVGPPALWLRLRVGQQPIATDESWEVAQGGAAWRRARLATKPPEIPPWHPLYESQCALDSARGVWPGLAALAAASLILVLLVQRRFPSRSAGRMGRQFLAAGHWPFVVLGVVIIARIALLVHDVPLLPRVMGFDATGHEQYIQYILDRHALPLAGDGWKTYEVPSYYSGPALQEKLHEPPLYYLGSAGLLEACGLTLADDEAVSLLRIVNGIIGLIHCWLALLCLRLIFPENFSLQAVGLLLVAFLPPHLYLSQYVTNEPLAALFITVALYLSLLVLRRDHDSLWLCAGIGAALGAALLTRFSCLLAAPFPPAVLALRLLARKDYSPRHWLGSPGVVILCCLVVCGWHYASVWAHFGKLLLPNWETDPASAWWQDPGYRTSAFYSTFGRALVFPLFSGFHSFADGLYSTLWGDGGASGAARQLFRPPWNYDLMSAGYWLAIVLSLVLIVGLVAGLVCFVRQPAAQWAALLGMVPLFGLGMIYLSLRGPWVAHVKAFYALPALVPFATLLAVGWDRLQRKHPLLGTLLWVVLLVWTMTVYGAFWIRRANPQTPLVRGLYLAEAHHNAEAAKCLSRALELDQSATSAGQRGLGKFRKTEIHSILGMVLDSLDRLPEAAAQYACAVSLHPQDAELRCRYAVALVKGGRIDAAIHQLETAPNEHPTDIPANLELPELLVKLRQAYAATLAKAGRTEEAIRQFEAALSQQPTNASASFGLAELLSQKGRYREATARYGQALAGEPNLISALNNLAWLLATCPDGQVRNGPRAVELAKRACHLTEWKQPLLIGTLAAAYAEAGSFPDAVAMAEKARDQARAENLGAVAKRNEELLRLYRAGKPCREQ